jgi:hypothetical protein
VSSGVGLRLLLDQNFPKPAGFNLADVGTSIHATHIVVISWRQPINNPVAEWGHLLAYMPQLRRRIERRQPRVLLLPPPHLNKGNEVNPRETLGRYAARQGRAVAEVLAETQSAVRDVLHRAERADLYVRLERGRRPAGE